MKKNIFLMNLYFSYLVDIYAIIYFLIKFPNF